MTKHAVIQTGGKQYLVAEGDVIDVEKLEGEKFKFDALYIRDEAGPKVGKPTVGTVEAASLGETKGPKVLAYKFKRRQNYHRKKGHRQKFTSVKIEAINVA